MVRRLKVLMSAYACEPGKGPQPATREAVYPLTEGLTNRRLGELVREAIERAPELPEWIEPSLLSRETWRDWRASLAQAHREPGAAPRL